MKWTGRRQSGNVESGGGGMGRMATGGGIGTLVLGLLIYFLGGDPSAVLDSQPSRQPAGYGGERTSQRAQLNTPEQQFVATVLADTEDVWHEVFRRLGRQYREPKLVLFSDEVQSACGIAGSSTGPFYCPIDEKLYVDLSFFNDLNTRYGAPGDFAQAYVLAHEVGHHVQNQLGTLEKIDALKQRASKAQANQLSVRVELQADYYAGVWAHYAQKRNLLETGDVEEGLRAAAAVGDDKLQQEARGYIVPDSFTHGTSQQRATWFNRGFQSGDLQGDNTFQ
jgi:predicted metalloprotease